MNARGLKALVIDSERNARYRVWRIRFTAFYRNSLSCVGKGRGSTTSGSTLLHLEEHPSRQIPIMLEGIWTGQEQSIILRIHSQAFCTVHESASILNQDDKQTMSLIYMHLNLVQLSLHQLTNTCYSTPSIQLTQSSW
jgi:hypothetical protein